MIDINIAFFFQLANFIVLIFILNALLLKPVPKHLSARDAKIKGSHDEAKENADRAEQLLASFESELAEARVKANQAFSSFQQEGVAEQRAKLATAKDEAQQKLDQLNAKLKEATQQAAKAREGLEKIAGIPAKYPETAPGMEPLEDPSAPKRSASARASAPP